MAFLRPVVALAAALLAVSSAGCYKGPAAEDPTFGGQGSHYPIGVLRPTQEHPDIGVVAGIYPTPTIDDAFCCWVGANAAFEVAVPPHRRELVVTTFIPPLRPFKERPQTVDIVVDEAKPVHYTLRFGVNFLHVPITPRSEQRVADVAMTAGWTFVPRNMRYNADSRELAFYLKAVRAGSR